jgi:PTH1 family peptidyl-tRNA hydrolase
MEKKSFKIVVGLGNPGKRYAGTYHNIGEEALRMIAGGNGFKRPFSVWKGKPFEYLKGEQRTYIRPLTYMNESGKAVLSALKHFGVKPEEMLVIHDDSDIESGESKLSYGRGSAGHNGIKSIMDYLGTDDFWRLRIGVRGTHAEKAGDFVLKKISPEDKEKLEKALIGIQADYSE